MLASACWVGCRLEVGLVGEVGGAPGDHYKRRVSAILDHLLEFLMVAPLFWAIRVSKLLSDLILPLKPSSVGNS